MGVWYGLGTALGSMLNESGGPAIIGRGWCSQVLNELDAYVCSSVARDVPCSPVWLGMVGLWGGVGVAIW